MYFLCHLLFVRVSSRFSVCFQICHYGSIFLIGIYLQIGAGCSTFVSGIVIGSQAVGSMFSTIYCQKTSIKYSIIIGFIGLGLVTPFIIFVKVGNATSLGITLMFIKT